MNDQVTLAIHDSAYDFRRVVWPVIRTALGGRELIQSELQDDRCATTLDRRGGFDAWVVRNGGTMFSIASRVQWPGDRWPESWHTHTIRYGLKNGYDTEWDKRIAALLSGDALPDYTIQAYLTKPAGYGRLLGAGIIRTRSLYEYCLPRHKLAGAGYRNHHEGVFTNENPADGTTFLCAHWHWLGIDGLPSKMAS